MRNQMEIKKMILLSMKKIF